MRLERSRLLATRAGGKRRASSAGQRGTLFFRSVIVAGVSWAGCVHAGLGVGARSEVLGSLTGSELGDGDCSLILVRRTHEH